MTKLCCECEHYRNSFLPSHPRCNRIIDPVEGGPGEWCDIERRNPNGCGEGGEFWQKKEHVLLRFWKWFDKEVVECHR